MVLTLFPALAFAEGGEGEAAGLSAAALYGKRRKGARQ